MAAGSSTVATVLGTMIAILLSRFEFRGKAALAGLAILPLIVPYVVLGVALLILFTALDIQLSMLTVIVGHAIVALPYTALIVLARLVGSEPQLEEAAMDLGATYPSTLRLVVIPMALPAIISAWITAFTVSFDEFAIALFLAGKDTTFPVYLYGQLRFANTLPVLIAAAVLLMVGTLVLVLLADRIRRAGRACAQAAGTASGIRIPASAARSSALSVDSHGRSRSSRPKWPYAAVCW